MSEQEQKLEQIRSILRQIHCEHTSSSSRPARENKYEGAQSALRQRALQYIGVDHGKSFGQVFQILREKFPADEYSDELIKEVIRQLIEDQYIDEKLCGRRLIKRHSGRKQKSREYLRRLMEKQGISPDIIASLNSEILPDEVTANNYFLLRLSEWDLDHPEKIVRHFASRGFPAGITLRIMRKYANGNE